MTFWPTGPPYHPASNKEPLNASFACKSGRCWHDRPIHQVSKRPFCIRQRRIGPRRQSRGRYQSTSTGPEYNAGGSSYESNLSKQVARRIWILATDGRTRTGRLSSVGGKSGLYKTDWQPARATSSHVKRRQGWTSCSGRAASLLDVHPPSTPVFYTKIMYYTGMSYILRIEKLHPASVVYRLFGCIWNRVKSITLKSLWKVSVYIGTVIVFKCCSIILIKYRPISLPYIYFLKINYSDRTIIRTWVISFQLVRKKVVYKTILACVACVVVVVVVWTRS